MAAAPSITATNAGNVEHGRVVLGGPVYVFLQVVGYATVAAALLVVIDSLRRPASHFGGASARRWMWAGPQSLLLALIALLWLSTVTTIVSASLLEPLAGFVTLYLFFCAMLQIAYLLVVVFPRHNEPIPPEVDQELPHE